MPQPEARTARWLLLALSALVVGACTDASTNPPIVEEYDHDLGPGASARDFLAGDEYNRLVVQIQYVEGQAPTAEALASLRDFLEARLNKPGGVVIETPRPIQIERQATYSAADIRSIEGAHRTRFTEDRTMAAYFLWIDGEYSESANVLGIAYNNTSMAIFAETIDEHTGGTLQPSAGTVESTVAMHEFGHILGLVNTGSPMQTDHQDEQHGHHCDVEDCLMYWAVRTTDFIANLMGGVPDLDQQCLDDLQANGGK